MNLLQDLPQPQLKRRRVTVDDYHRMAEHGLFAPDERVELIGGEIIDMAPIGTKHYWAVVCVDRALRSALAGSSGSASPKTSQPMVAIQSPVRLDRHNEPEPDVALLRPDLSMTALPCGSDCLLLIEVSDSTLAYDVRVKLPLYAQHGVPEVWIVDLVHQQLHRYAAAVDGRYSEQQSLAAPARLALPGLDGVSLELAAVWASGAAASTSVT